MTEAKPLSAEAQSTAPKAAADPKAQSKQEEEDKHVAHMKKWQEEFGKNSLGKISSKWNDQLVRNKTEFEKSAQQLQEYELKLIDQLKAIETIQSTSASVVEQYKKNIRDLTEVQTHQGVVIDELTAIESELDKILPQYEDHYQTSYYHPSEGHFDHNSASLQNAVFHQAQEIDRSIDVLDAELADVQRKVDNHQMKNDRELPYRALSIGAGASASERGRYGAEYPG